MQFSPFELKDQLLSALDKDNHVVDMRGVLEVISILENYPITREALEQTRIGKLVNEMRKKTDNKELAKRAKNLVRKWQQFISQSPAPSQRSMNGDGFIGSTGSSLPPHLQRISGIGSKPVSPASRPVTPSSNKSNVSPPSLPSVSSPALSGSRPGTPVGGGNSRISPRLSMTRPMTPGGSTSVSPLLHGGRVQVQTANHFSSTPQSIGRSRVSPTGPQRYLSSKTSPSMGIKDSKRSGSPSETLSKVNTANKRKRRIDEDQNSNCDGFPPLKKSANGEQCIETSQLKSVSMRQDQSGSGDCKSRSPNSPLRNGLVNSHYNCNAVHTTSHQPDTPNTRNLRQTTLSSSLTSPGNHNIPDVGDNCQSNSTTTLSGRRNAALKLNTDNVSTPVRKRIDSCCSELSDKSRADTPSQHTPKISKPRVKTTAEILQHLHENEGLKLSGSETVTRIALNQIEKEPDLQGESIVPPEAKPRPRRKPGTVLPTATDKTVQQAKKERMHKFLCNSVETVSKSSELLSMMIKEDTEKDELRESMANYMAPPSIQPVELTSKDTRHSSMSVLSAESESAEKVECSVSRKMLSPEKAIGAKEISIKAAELSRPAERDEYVPGLDPWELLPKIPVVENDNEDEADIDPPTEVTDAMVERMNSEHWQGVNGQNDYTGQWRDWKESYSARTTNDDLLHILPYVNIDF